MRILKPQLQQQNGRFIRPAGGFFVLRAAHKKAGYKRRTNNSIV